MIVVGPLFDSGAKGGVDSDGNDIAGPNEWQSSLAAQCENRRSPGHKLVRATGLEPARLSTPGPKTLICRISGVVGWREMVSELGFRETPCRRLVARFGLFWAVPLAIR